MLRITDFVQIEHNSKSGVSFVYTCTCYNGRTVPESSAKNTRAPFTGLYDIVALAASAGGLDALRHILNELPSDLPAALVAVQHLDPNHPSMLAPILARTTELVVKEAEQSDVLVPGLVLIAPPNRHLLVNADGSILLTQSELVRFVRPSAYILFESQRRQGNQKSGRRCDCSEYRDGAIYEHARSGLSDRCR
jgi:chemotaxis response regulator CheB